MGKVTEEREREECEILLKTEKIEEEREGGREQERQREER